VTHQQGCGELLGERCSCHQGRCHMLSPTITGLPRFKGRATGTMMVQTGRPRGFKLKDGRDGRPDASGGRGGPHTHITHCANYALFWLVHDHNHMRENDDPDSGSSQFFFLKWNQALIAPGRNTLGGDYVSFGYVASPDAQNVIQQLDVGDVIVKAAVIQGLDSTIAVVDGAWTG